MKRFLTSLCGILLITSFTYSSHNLQSNQGEQNNPDIKSFFEGGIISLNIIFLFVFLICILSIIKEEDNNEKKNHPLL